MSSTAGERVVPFTMHEVWNDTSWSINYVIRHGDDVLARYRYRLHAEAVLKSWNELAAPGEMSDVRYRVTKNTRGRFCWHLYDADGPLGGKHNGYVSETIAIRHAENALKLYNARRAPINLAPAVLPDHLDDPQTRMNQDV